jgi:hypothetical protein
VQSVNILLRKFGSLNISHPCWLAQPVTRIAVPLIFNLECTFTSSVISCSVYRSGIVFHLYVFNTVKAKYVQ